MIGYVLMVLYLAVPPAPYLVLTAEVDDRAGCLREADRLRVLARQQAAEGRVVSWVECLPRGLP